MQEETSNEVIRAGNQRNVWRIMKQLKKPIIREKIQSNGWPGKNSSEESMKNIMEVVQERNLGRVWNKMVWCMPIKRPEKKRKTKYNKEEKQQNKKGEGSGEWSHPEDLSTYSVMDMCSSHFLIARVSDETRLSATPTRFQGKPIWFSLRTFPYALRCAVI